MQWNRTSYIWPSQHRQNKESEKLKVWLKIQVKIKPSQYMHKKSWLKYLIKSIVVEKILNGKIPLHHHHLLFLKAYDQGMTNLHSTAIRFPCPENRFQQITCTVFLYMWSNMIHNCCIEYISCDAQRTNSYQLFKRMTNSFNVAARSPN